MEYMVADQQVPDVNLAVYSDGLVEVNKEQHVVRAEIFRLFFCEASSRQAKFLVPLGRSTSARLAERENNVLKLGIVLGCLS